MRKVKMLLICCTFFSIIIFSSWGYLVHRTVNQLAIYQLPKSMEPFFFQHMDYLVRNSIRPDERRNTDPMEASRHFIDLEAYGDSAAWKMPYRWDEAVAIYSKDSLLKYGYAPYWIQTMKEKLTAAFKSGNTDSILFYATDLGHYIGDAHVPLHTSINYDGQLTNQKGLHSLWESTIPELEITHYNLNAHHRARYLPHPEIAIWTAVRHAHQLVQGVFNEELEATKYFPDSVKYRIQMRNGREVKSYSTAFARAYAQRLGKTINQQLLNAAALCADFWYTAWVDAGKPDLKTTVTRQEKEAYKLWNRAYRQNNLIKKNLLLSRQTKTTED